MASLDSIRACLAVRPNKNGLCQCARFGPPGSSSKSYADLCKESSLPVGVGQKIKAGASAASASTTESKKPRTRQPKQQVGSLNMAKDYEKDYPSLEAFEALGEDFGPDFFGLEGLVTKEQLMSHGFAALGGAGGLLAVGSVLNKIDWFADKPKLKLGTAAVVGILGGRLLWFAGEQPGNPNESSTRDAAMGFVGAVTGTALAKLITDLIPEEYRPTIELGSAEVVSVPPYDFFSATRGPVRDSQMEQVMVERDDPMALADGAFDAVEVADDQLSNYWGG